MPQSTSGADNATGSPLPIVVQKYGGSSVASVEHIRRVAARIVATADRGYRVVAVVSAMGGTTNELLSKAKQVSANPTSRELDMLLTVGERISMALLSMAIHDLGHRAVSFTGSQSGIITNVRHGCAKVVEVRPYRVQDELEQGRIVIVAGYQGVSYRREVTTLGRGGSDTTAICLAAALDAEYCEICSDVDGVFTSDPRIVSDARPIATMSHDEMLEMARSGARVLNADAIEYARRHGVAIYARATASATDGTSGTIIRKDLDTERDEVTAVAGRKDAFWLLYDAETPAAASEALSRALTAIDADRPGPSLTELTPTASGGALVSMRYWLENEPDPAGLERCARDAIATTDSDGELRVEYPVGHVAIVGPDLAAAPELLGRFVATVESAAGRVTHLSARSTAVEARVDATAVNDALRALHREFLGATSG